MAERFTVLLYGFIFLGLVSLMGCSSLSATKPFSTSEPEVSSPPSQATARGESDRQTRVSAPSSSLEALRQGKSPAPSPLKDIYFEFDRYDLRADARVTLKANAEWLKANPSARAEIEGHADERGTNEYNLALGVKRAQAAKDYLVTMGISGDRLSTISYGEEAPVCREHTEECWQRNRHDRFVVITGRPTS
ncbi:MAG: peptidoglycan-associated lipoprotein Pal [Deltaproteobacteria bacterium]|nr:peptidoglycan-associated lipoprotein Pal [Deltaproteobacteria bacterium]